MVIIVKCEVCGKDMELLNLEMNYSEKQTEIQYFGCCDNVLMVQASYLDDEEKERLDY